VGSDAAMDMVDSSVDASGPLAPYGACTGAGDCNPGETCRMADGKGVCAAPCASKNECATPAGSYTALVTCGSDNQCRLDCSTTVGNGPPKARTCPSGMTCVLEPGEFSWQVGTPTCYP
jgi:hypothetical protein